MSWLGQGRCTCPACGQRIYDRDAHERVVTRQVKLVYMCPGCGTYLKQVKDKSFKTISSMLCLMALFLAIDIGFLIYTQDVCVFSLLSCVLFMCFYYLRFTLVNRFVVWFPQCTKCGYDMRGSDGQCSECGGEAETHPEKIIGPINPLDREIRQRLGDDV